jgi:site-specific recombinase XerD
MDKYWELKKTLSNSLNQEIINEFLLNLKIANCSDYTLYNYRLFLERFFLNEKTPYYSLTSEDIQKWLMKHKTRFKESTIGAHLTILSSFYNFCVKEEYIDRSPIKRRWYPRLPQPIPKFLEKNDIAKTRQQSEKSTLRNQMLIEFMLTSGCRVSEVNGLNREDVNLENRTARVYGKGKKIRIVHFSERCGVLLEKYLDSRPKISPALFVTEKEKRLSIDGIKSVIKKIGKEAGLSTRLHAHRFRHTFATELLEKGAELSFIGEELGHKHLSTTQIYARLPKSEIVRLYRKFMG